MSRELPTDPLCPYCESGSDCPNHPAIRVDATRGLYQHTPPTWNTPWSADIDLTRARDTIRKHPPPHRTHPSPRIDGGFTHSRSRR